ncbi:hypothetical protein SAMN05414139_09034 [Burkholderia sp. D7]|nr:hypothetical protein SAMN05414139_09034 [Burkholderia sp. D7]
MRLSRTHRTVALSFILAPAINELTYAQADVDATPTAGKVHILSLVENGASAFHKGHLTEGPDTASRTVQVAFPFLHSGVS